MSGKAALRSKKQGLGILRNGAMDAKPDRTNRRDRACPVSTVRSHSPWLLSVKQKSSVEILWYKCATQGTIVRITKADYIIIDPIHTNPANPTSLMLLL